jgi:hypothetical protein
MVIRVMISLGTRSFSVKVQIHLSSTGSSARAEDLLLEKRSRVGG